jgi:hypothetical protein
MRTKHELLILLQDKLWIISRKEYSPKGLCGLVSELRWDNEISLEEYLTLKIYIRENRPKAFSSFAALINFNSPFYWPEGWKYPRRRWLNKHICKSFLEYCNR